MAGSAPAGRHRREYSRPVGKSRSIKVKLAAGITVYQFANHAAARAAGSDPTVLVVSSAEVYGRVGEEDLPLTEDQPLAPGSPYAASKAGLIALTKGLGRELGPQGILTNAIAPSFIDTEQLRVDADDAGITLDEMRRVYSELIPVRRLASPDDIAAAVGMQRRFTGMAGYVPGAGALSAAVTAKLAIDAGLADYVVVYLGYWSSRPGGPYTFHAKDPVKASYEMPFGFYGQPVYFAAWQQRYCHDYNVKPDELAGVSMAARQWARLTPGAQETRPLSLPSVTTSTGQASLSMKAIRSAGSSGSTGRYAAPVLATASSSTTAGTPRGNASATTRSGPAPRPIR